MTNINIRTDEKVKKQAEDLFNELGLPLSTAINLFLRQAIREQKIPFDICLNIPNTTTIQAIEEGEKLVADNSAPVFKNTDELRGFLGV